MDEIEKLRALFKSAKNDYETLKKRAEAQAVSRHWASNQYLNFEPFYFEFNRFSKGRVLKEAPKKIANAYEYGFDAQDRAVFKRQYVSEKYFYEEFYFWQRDEILSYRFDYYDKKCVNVKRFVYEDGALKSIYSAFASEGYWIENFTYEGGKLAQKQWRGTDPYGGKFDRVINYEFDAMGELSLITENGYVRYQKPDKNMSYKKLYELAAQRLLPAIKETIKKHAPNCKLYCINLACDNRSLPPIIGFGSQEQRAQWLARKDGWLLWLVPDYEFRAEVEVDYETAKIFDLFNQETQLNDKYAQAKKLIWECVKQLKAGLGEFALDMTEDFTITATDCDLSNLRKDFIAINPEPIGA